MSESPPLDPAVRSSISGPRLLMNDLAAVMIRPRLTVRRIIDTDPNRFVKSIFFLAIISAVLKDFDLQGMEDLASLEPLLLTINIVAGIVFAVLFMLLAYYVLSWSATLVGRWLGGAGAFRQVRAAVAWGLAPFIWALAYRIPMALFALFSRAESGPPRLLIDNGRIVWSEGSLGSLNLWWLLLIVLLDFTVFIWYFLVASRTLAEAHQISSWRGFGVLLLAFIFPFAAMATLAFISWVYVQRLG